MSSRDRSPAARRRAYFHLQVAAQRLRTAADRLFIEETGITTAQAAVLMLVADHAGCSQSLIAHSLGQRESAVTAMIGRLQAAELVERRPSRRDGRAWELWPTDRGAAALRRLDTALSTVNGYLDQAIGEAGADEFVDTLQRLTDLLDTAP